MTEMESPYWAVVQTLPQQEFHVEDRLVGTGRETYLPRTNHRDLSLPRKEQKSRILPLFPSYVFVRLVTGWVGVSCCDGVLQILMSGDHPARVPDKVLDEIKGREIKGFVQLPKKLRRGLRVEIKGGMFDGYSGVYQGQDSRARARVLLNVLGCVELPAANLQVLA